MSRAGDGLFDMNDLDTAIRPKLAQLKGPDRLLARVSRLSRRVSVELALGACAVSVLIWSGATSFAQTPLPVYPGCAVPPPTFHNVWHIDPVNGQTPEAMTTSGIPMPAIGSGATAATQGSPQHPWNSLQAVFNPPAASGYSYPLLTTAPYKHAVGSTYQTVAGPLAGPIQPGDEILLMNGNYGAVTVGYGQIPGVNSPSFVTIAAAPGQTPVLTSLRVYNSSMLRFTGLKVQALFPPSITTTWSPSPTGAAALWSPTTSCFPTFRSRTRILRSMRRGRRLNGNMGVSASSRAAQTRLRTQAASLFSTCMCTPSTRPSFVRRGIRLAPTTSSTTTPTMRSPMAPTTC